MPVRLTQYHYAQAPQAFHDALSSFRLYQSHLKALCAYYNNIISDPFPSRSTVHTLYDQIVRSQKDFTAAETHLLEVSERIQYFEDPARTTWISRPHRRPYQYERERIEDVYAKHAARAVEMLGEAVYSDVESDGDSDSDVGEDSYSATIPVAKKKVHFLPFELTDRPRRGLHRIHTKEEVNADFESANEPCDIETTSYVKEKSKRKRCCPDDDYGSCESPRKIEKGT